MKLAPRLVALALAAASPLACQPTAEPAPAPLVQEPINGSSAVSALTGGDEGSNEADERVVATIDEEEVPVVDETPSPEFIASSHQFARDLWGTLLQEHEDNVLVSPASVFLAFLMTEPGAAGATLQQTQEVLHLGNGDVHGDAAALIALINNDSGPTIRIANRYFLAGIWSELLLPDFQATLESAYGAGVGVVPFGTDPEAARAEINGWVSEQTNERIEELLPDGIINELVRAVLVNAVYFDAAWATPFDASQTEDAPFATPGGEVQVPMMSRRDNFKFAAGDGWTGVEIPYEGDEWSFIAVLPDDGAGFDLFEAAETVAASHRSSVDLSFPKFT